MCACVTFGSRLANYLTPHYLLKIHKVYINIPRNCYKAYAQGSCSITFLLELIVRDPNFGTAAKKL
jgi:hypothetical protein